MDSETVAALSAPAPSVDAINRWIREQQQIAYDLAQVEAAAEAVQRILEQKKKALLDQREALESFAPVVLEHFKQREKNERSGRTFADVEQGYVVKLKKQPTRLKFTPNGSGDFFAWDNANDKAFTRWKVKATLKAQEFEQLQAFFPNIAVFAEREPEVAMVNTRFKVIGELPPEWQVVGGSDKLYVEPPPKIGAGTVTEAIEEGE